ncbi:hypothetical protein UlMin_005443 [Ulmus minor]
MKYSFISTTSISANINNVPMLNRTNFKDWKENMMILLGCMDIDLALRMPKPDELNEESTQEDEVYWGKWERSNRLSLMIMKRGIPEAFRGAVTDEVTNASDFLAEIQKRFAKNDKLSDDLLVHLVLISLPAQFNQFKGKRKNKDNKVATSKGPEQKKQKVEVTCFFCNKPGHTKKECTKYAAWRVKKGIFLTLVCSEGCLSYRKPSDAERCIYVRDGQSVEVEAIWHFRLLLKFGYCCSFGNNTFTLSINSNVVGTGLLNVYDNLYLLETFPSYNETLHVESRGTKRKLNKDNSASLWHKRLGHISKSRVERLVSDGILKTLDFSDFDICVECIKGKQTKTKKLGANRATDVLELIHTNICGPYPTASWNGQQYFITFIDDYSRYGYLFLIHEKSQSLDLQLNKRIKSVRSDRGGEYYGRYDGSGEQRPGPFAKYLEECGIVPQYTMPGSPSMNAEARPYKPHEKKLDSKTVSSYFIGYAEQSRGFKFYDPAIRSIFETGTATFFEDVEFGGRNQARNIVFEEEEGSTIAFDNVQVSLPIIDQEVNLDPQPTDNIGGEMQFRTIISYISRNVR